MRVSQERIGINLAKPINMENSNDTCFGNEWSATAPECRQCGLYDLCCTVYNKTKVKTKKSFQLRSKARWILLTLTL